MFNVPCIQDAGYVEGFGKDLWRLFRDRDREEKFPITQG